MVARTCPPSAAIRARTRDDNARRPMEFVSGKRLGSYRHCIMIQQLGDTPPSDLHVVVNWADELKSRLSGTGI